MLVARGEDVHLELARLRGPGGREAAREDAVVASPSWFRLCQATTKSPSASAAIAGATLIAGGVGVDLELDALRRTRGVEALGEDAENALIVE